MVSLFSPFFSHDCWILFAIITLNSFFRQFTSSFLVYLDLWVFVLFLHLQYFSVFSFCLTYWICDPLSLGCRILVFASSLCLQWMCLVQWLVLTLNLGLVPASLLVDKGFTPLIGRVMSSGVL